MTSDVQTTGRATWLDPEWRAGALGWAVGQLARTGRMAGRALDVPSGDPALRRLRDAYLEPWSMYGCRAELVEQCSLALGVAPLARALTWRRILRGVHAGERAEWADSVPGWTAEYLEPGPLAQVPA